MLCKAIYKGLFMKNVQIRIDENLLRTIDRHAASYKLSPSAMVREALKNWIPQREIQEFEEVLKFQFSSIVSITMVILMSTGTTAIWILDCGRRPVW